MGSRLQGKVAIITGASRGLGEFCAVAYGSEGATVAVVARTEKVADERFPGTIYETAEKVTDAGGEGFPVVCNVADEESVNAMVSKVIDRYGRIDILMNNAAAWPPGSLQAVKPRHFDLGMRVNLNGSFYGIRAALPAMTEQGSGSIINVSSHAADNYGQGVYGVSKRAIEALTIGFAAELAESGIAVNCLKPTGAIVTPGLLYGNLGDEVYRALPPPDRYVEAAILLGLITPDAGTGLIVDDSEVVARWASEPLRSQLAALPLR
jgi:NAD(P)-dependent dehydrogenase (short-subunit alcohol dehydrogenase family)